MTVLAEASEETWSSTIDIIDVEVAVPSSPSVYENHGGDGQSPLVATSVVGSVTLRFATEKKAQLV